MKKTLIRAFSLVLVLALMLLSVGCSSAPAQELVIFSWADYVDPDLLAQFTEETGIAINYNYFTSNEEMLSKLEAVEGGDYDIVIASDYIINIARSEGLLKEIDKEKVPNYSNLNPAYLNQFFDPDGLYTVPYVAGTPLIVYDPSKVTCEITGYNSLWDPSLKDQLVIMDDMRNVIGMTMKSMGYTLNTEDPEVIAQAGEKLLELKPNIRALDGDTPHEKLISGECTIGYIFTSQVSAVLAERPDFQVCYPEEGMGFGIDAFFVPVNAPHADAAFEFLNFMCDPEVSAKASVFTQYINCNSAATEYLPQEFLDNAAVNIPSDVLGEIEFMQDISPEATEQMNEIWNTFKQA
ncbi:MAG: polyamine ABC transporter substrate-binding protein [Candidatus Spyradocola sp.]|jgi:spermidine/putrescine transport system substrate-binding protein